MIVFYSHSLYHIRKYSIQKKEITVFDSVMAVYLPCVVWDMCCASEGWAAVFPNRQYVYGTLLFA